MAAEAQDSDNIFYRFGRGIFLAFVFVSLPMWAVMRWYPLLEAWLNGVADLPVYSRMQDNFQSGSQIAGALFAEKLHAFYESSDTIWREKSDATSRSAKGAQWSRPGLEQELAQRFSRGKNRNAQAYLDYIERYKTLAMREMQRTKVPASVTLAQGLLEADAGRGYLATQANNHFGIKCMLQQGYRADGAITRTDFYHHPLAIDCLQRTDDYQWDHFEVYASPSESYRRHSLLLQGERYAWMIRQYEIGEMYTLSRKIYGRNYVPYYAAWSVGLKQSGYATAKNYAEILTLIIETYRLWEIDYELL